MNESLIQKTRLAEERNPKTRLAEERYIDPKTRSGGERFVHLPDTDQICMRQLNESLIQKAWLAEERNIDPKTRLAEERNIDPKTRSGGERLDSVFGYGSLDLFSRDLQRLRRGNRKDLFTSFTFTWLGLVRRE